MSGWQCVVAISGRHSPREAVEGWRVILGVYTTDQKHLNIPNVVPQFGILSRYILPRVRLRMSSLHFLLGDPEMRPLR